MKDSRQKLILELINRREYVPFSELCRLFNVSPATMRRDLTQMDRAHLIQREHGGARTLMKDQDATTIQTRLMQANTEKEKIAKAAFPYIQNESYILLDASTTCLKIAERIAQSDLHLTVVTNYFDIASLLKDCGGLDVLFLGGFIRKHFNSTTGSFSETMVDNLNFDLSFIGCDSISPETGLANNRIDVVDLKTKIISHSKQTICVCDHSKFTKNAFIPFAGLDQIDTVITDDGLDPAIHQAFKEKEIQLILAK